MWIFNSNLASGQRWNTYNPAFSFYSRKAPVSTYYIVVSAGARAEWKWCFWCRHLWWERKEPRESPRSRLFSYFCNVPIWPFYCQARRRRETRELAVVRASIEQNRFARLNKIKDTLHHFTKLQNTDQRKVTTLLTADAPFRDAQSTTLLQERTLLGGKFEDSLLPLLPEAETLKFELPLPKSPVRNVCLWGHSSDSYIGRNPLKCTHKCARSSRTVQVAVSGIQG